MDQVAEVDRDQRSALDRELGVEPHQVGQDITVRGDDGAAARQQVLADVDQHLAEQRLLTGEVVVQRRAAHACSGADVVHRDVREAALGEQVGGDAEDLGAPGAHERNSASPPAAPTRLGTS